MRKRFMTCLGFMLIFSMLFNLTACAAEETISQKPTENVVISMQIGNPQMTVNGETQHIDENNTSPLVVNNRTLVPVRAVIEAMGGNAMWNADTQTAELHYGTDTIRLVINSTTAYLNDEERTLDTAPQIINDRTMLPIRFIAESFQFTVAWEGDTQTVTLSGKAANTENTPVQPGDSDDTEAVGKFDLEHGTVLLNNNIEMPILGIGTYRLTNEQAENSVYWALRDGYRLIDTARIYGNEEGVGRGIQKAISEGLVKREDIFVTTKMWTDDYDDGDNAIDASLRRLGLDYIDLMILHHSQPSNDVEAYQAMERAVEDGKLRSIGLSNFYTPEDFDRLVNQTTITPVLLQNETHPYYQGKEMKEHLEKYGTVMESWFPLGGRGNTQVLFNDSTIMDIAQAHNKTSAQIILRWHLQAGNIAIPGSSNEDHILENVSIFDFELTDEEMERMTALDKNDRFASY